MKRKKFSKFEIALVLTFLGSICIFFLYKYFLLFYFNTRYEDLFLVYNSNYYAIIFFCLYIIFVVSNFYSEERKLSPKKYKKIAFCIGVVIFLSVFFFNTGAWVVTKEKISYNTILDNDKISYSYNDIDNAVLYYNESSGIKMRGVSPEYVLSMNNGDTITLCLFESYYDSYDDLISFDKKIADKRTTKGEFRTLHIRTGLNQYYKDVFENQSKK